jgi:restriction system protein
MIPDFQKIMLPFLNLLMDGTEHSTIETNEYLAKYFGLTEDEVNQYLPSGSQKIFSNRVAWTKSYLKMYGLLEPTKRGCYKISDNGKQFMLQNPTEVNVKILKQWASKNSDKSRSTEGSESEENDVNHEITTPEEQLESNYLLIRQKVAQELLQKIKSSSPSFFENLVVDLLVKMGYGGSFKDAGKSIGKSGDEGIDGIIKEDKLGLDIIYVQAKRWENVVGRPEIQKFVGALAGQGAKKGVFITTSWFTKEAKEYQPKNDTKIVLIDGEQLAELMIDHNLAVSTVNVFEIKRIDYDYFEIE